MGIEIGRGEFLKGAAGMLAAGICPQVKAEEDVIAIWQRETEQVAPDAYQSYLDDGNTRGLATLEKLELAFAKVAREAVETLVVDVPVVWNVYNMGYIVKTRESLFSIDLVHRLDAKFASKLDFALITHNHADHWRNGFYRAMNGAGKTVISNFLDNYGAADWKKGGPSWMEKGGYTRGRKVFKIKDVEITTSLVDHNRYLIDFTTAFEIRVGGWLLYHTGDCGSGSEAKLQKGLNPDLWLFFPGCGIDVAKAIDTVKPKRVVFGHLWELGHGQGRLDEPLIRKALAAAKSRNRNVSFALWGDKIC